MRPPGRVRRKMNELPPMRSILAVCLLLVAVPAALPVWPGAPSAVEGKTSGSRGVRLLGEGRFEEALKALDEELAKRPRDMRLSIARVKGLIEVGRWSEALSRAEDLATAMPGHPGVTILLGDCCFLTFQPARAMACYRSVLEDPRWGNVALPKFMNAALSRLEDDKALAAAGAARKAGRRLTLSARMLEIRAESNPGRRVALLEALAKENPEIEGARKKADLLKTMAWRSNRAVTPPPSFPGRAKIREIYREPSVRVVFNGKRKSWLAFDTGSESLLVNQDLTKKLRFPILADSFYGGWGIHGKKTTRRVLIPKLTIAGLTMENTSALVNSRDSEFRSNKGGYVGLGPFLKWAVSYDRRRSRFALWPSGTPPAKALGGVGESFPILWVRGLPLVPVGLMGGDSYPFLLDTGAPYTILSAKYARRLGVTANTGKYGKLYGLGLSGAFTSNVAEGVILRVGAHEYKRPISFVSEIPQHFPVPLYGVLGRDILNSYMIFFDGPECRVTLLKYKHPGLPSPLRPYPVWHKRP